jgi:tetratricopeptide (TPR) repeat protein
MLEFHLEDAKARFPDEPRWALVQGIAQDLRTWPDWRDDVALNVQPIPAAATTVAYEQALSRPEVRQEALVRLGEFELRLGLTAKALDCFRQAGTPQDPSVAYWLHLFEGNALEQLNRPTEAIAAYEAALAAAPFALTATVALGSVLVTQHRATEGAALVSRVLAIPPRPDPWSVYTFPDWRYFPNAMAELRREVAR